jgi:hypothetical protein
LIDKPVANRNLRRRVNQHSLKLLVYFAAQSLLLEKAALLSPPENISALSPSKAGLLKP